MQTPAGLTVLAGRRPAVTSGGRRREVDHSSSGRLGSASLGFRAKYRPHVAGGIMEPAGVPDRRPAPLISREG